MTDALLMIGNSVADQDLYYKTHFLAGDPFVYVESNGRSVLVVSPMESGRARKESTVPEVQTFDDFGYKDLLKELNNRQQAFTRALTAVVEKVEANRVTVPASFPALYADALRGGGIEVEVDPDLLSAKRRHKSPEEIAAIEEAQRATERATAHAVDIVAHSEDRDGILHFEGEPLTSERLRAEIETALVRDNMDVSGSPIVAGGPGAADPHWLGEGPLRAGEAIVMDIFPRSRRTRYYADMTRTIVKGNPSETLRSMYDATLRAQEAALAQIRSGVNGRDVHQAVLDVYRQAGFEGKGPGPRYIHGTGHGVGLAIHEGPPIGALDFELQEGDVVTVEPGLYDPSIGGVRIEDLVAVTKDGYRNLTQFPKKFEV